MKVSELIQDVGIAEKKIVEDKVVTGIAYDSRYVTPDSVFVAIPGLQVDGRHFVPEALKKGASLIVTEGALFDNLTISQVRVGDVRQALAKIAALFFDHPTKKMYLSGVTGTNGKTTLTYLLEAIWQEARYKTGVIGTINTRFGSVVKEASHTTPESRDLQDVFNNMVESGVTHAAIEVSSHAISLSRVQDVHFNSCIFTNLTQDHLDFHSTMEEYFDAKQKLFTRHFKESCKLNKMAIVQGDDSYASTLIQNIKSLSLPLTTYGFDAKNDFHPQEYTLNASGFSGTFVWGKKEIFLKSPLMGRFNILNVMAAVIAASHAGVNDDVIARAIQNFTHTPGRLERVIDKNGRHVFVDYAHTPDALKNVMETLSELKTKKLIVVFGCGGDRDPLKRPKMGFEAARLADVCIVTSDNPRTEDPHSIINQILPGVEKAGLKAGSVKGFVVEPDRKKALEKAVRLSGPDDIILVAGKGHEDYQIIGKTKTHFSDQEELRKLLKV